MDLGQIKERSFSVSYDENGGRYNINIDPLLDVALNLLDQIIKKEKENDKEFKKEMADSSSIKDWEKSIGEGWTLFHLKQLKDLLKTL
jgi:hypothetical protein